ncbi:MAG: sigma-70 family RNA polymerase sigma factor [Bacteroidota bacterium]
MTQPNKILDGLLVLELRSGNKRAAALLVKKWHIKFCNQAYWYVRDREIAKDVAQDSWGIIFRKIGKLKDPNSFGSWAMKIVTRSAIDKIRSSQRELQKLKLHYDTSNSIPAGDPPLDHRENIDLLLSAITELPQKQQLVLRLFYLEEFSITQISEVLEVSPGTVKSRLFTAREHLKTILKNRNYEE